jgi:hypothetical protein
LEFTTLAVAVIGTCTYAHAILKKKGMDFYMEINVEKI